MNWGDEDYVRIYTKDTVDLIAMGPEARLVLWELIRKADHSGIIPLGKHGLRGLASLIHVPFEWVERALALLATDGCIRATTDSIFIPNFINAQQARRSDAQRKRDERERRAAIERSRNVTPGHETVTSGHATTTRPDTSVTNVTKCHPLPGLALPGLAGPGLTRQHDPPLPLVAPPTGAGDGAKSRTRSRGTRLPDDWRPSEATQVWAREQGIANPLGQLEDFHDFWRGVPGARGVKLDWDATYRNRLRQIEARPSAVRLARGHVQSAERRAWIVPEDMP